MLRTAFLLGLVAGSRTMTPLAAVSMAAQGGRLPLQGTPLGILATPQAATTLAMLAAGEFASDKLPGMGSRTTPFQFTGRLTSGAVCGAAVGLPRNAPAGMAAGVAGAALGTLVTALARSGLAKRLGADLPAALLEDAAVVGSAALLSQVALRSRRQSA